MVLPVNSLLRPVLIFLALAGGALAQQISEDRELKEIDLTTWNCANRPEGSGRSPDTAERNRLKNRFAVNLSGMAVTAFDTNSFIRHIADFDAQTKGKRRKDLSEEEKRRLEILEEPIVSHKSYMVLAYAGSRAMTNYSSRTFHACVSSTY